jgi:hypothetical protein
MSTTQNPQNSNIKEVILPDWTRIEVYLDPKQIDQVAEFVQLKSEDRRNLTTREQTKIYASIVKKQHGLYDHMDLTSTKNR